MSADYEIVCGLEVHVELCTASKIFCGCSTAFGSPPNTQVCPVCTGMPGALPVLNDRVVELAVRTGLALGCEIARTSRFDRKHYVYPDLPKAYQISQLYLPICRGGGLEIESGGVKKRIGIHEIHMEEDAGKLVHDPSCNCALIDYNRCGVPLLEIVTAPDLRGPDEASACLEKLREMLLFLGVSDCKMQEGSMRADVNVSVRPTGFRGLGTRTELKNMSSFKMIRQAIAYEAKRQIALLETGGFIAQQTRRWDSQTGKSLPMRGKENARDYRYFPDPDLPPVVVENARIDALRGSMPELREAKRARYQKRFGLTDYETEVLTSSREVAALFEAAAALCGQPRDVASLIMTDLLRLMTDAATPPENLSLPPEKLATIVTMLARNKINRAVARQLLELVFHEDADPSAYVDEHGLALVSDDALVSKAVEHVLAQNPKSVADFHGGKQKAFGFLMGQVMRQLHGKADPQVVAGCLRRVLNGGSAPKPPLRGRVP